ncbi:MAG: hypothetical protein JRI71_10195 [Deltaproteobacteria bacterium]|nr:hypothetical protein [Deltaproteobacteria bacterium]
MAITYSAVTNTITVTGYTEAIPCNFTDIYNADVAGSWGVVTRQCTNQLCFSAKLIIGDGSTATWLADTKKHILFVAGVITANWQQMIYVMASAHFRLGTLYSATNKTTRSGSSVETANTANSFRFIDVDYNGYVELYGSLLIGDGTKEQQVASVSDYPSSRGNIKIYNCLFESVTMSYAKNVDIYKLTVENASRPCATLEGTISDLSISHQYNGYFSFQFYYSVSTVKNLKITDIGAAADTLLAEGITGNAYLINPDFEKWTINWRTSPYPTVHRQYEFDLKVVNKGGTAINGATVRIWDKDSNLIVNTTTNASGVITTQILNYGYYTAAGGNTPTMKTPHEMRIYKYGKGLLSTKSSIEVKTNWVFTMYDDEHITQTTEATVAAYTGITINHTAETITISEDHTLNEIYDYCQYDIIAATKQLNQTIHTADGVNFISEYSFVVNTGITVTATDQKLSMIAGETYTLTGTAQFTGIIATTTTTRIPIKLTNIVDGSVYWVGKESDGSKIFEGTQSGSGAVTGYYEHTANIDVDIRVRKSSASVKYKPWVGEGSLVAAAFSLRIRQIPDSIVT